MIKAPNSETYGLKDSIYMSTKTENTPNIIRKETGMVILYRFHLTKFKISLEACVFDVSASLILERINFVGRYKILCRWLLLVGRICTLIIKQKNVPADLPICNVIEIFPVEDSF